MPKHRGPTTAQCCAGSRQNFRWEEGGVTFAFYVEQQQARTSIVNFGTIFQFHIAFPIQFWVPDEMRVWWGIL